MVRKTLGQSAGSLAKGYAVWDSHCPGSSKWGLLTTELTPPPRFMKQDPQELNKVKGLSEEGCF